MNNRSFSYFIIFSLFFLLSLLIFPHFFKLSNTLHLTLQWIAIFITFSIAILFIFHEKNFIKLNNNQKIFNSIMQAMKKKTNIVVFNTRGKVLFSNNDTHLCNKSQFIRKTLAHINSTKESISFKEAIDNFQSGEFLIHGAGNNMIQPKQWWLSHVEVCSKHDSALGELLFVSLTNLSSYIETYEQTKYNYEILEKFIDSAPFGLMYINKSNHVVGVNGTLCKWLETSKNEVLGQNIHNYIHSSLSFNPHEITGLMWFYLQTKRNNLLHVICVPGSEISSCQKTFIFCKVNSNDRLSRLSHVEKSWEQSSFLKSLIPAAIIDKNHKIKGWNGAFIAMVKGIINIDDNLIDLADPNKKHEIMENLNKASSQEESLSTFEFDFVNNATHCVVYMNSLMLNDKNSDYIVQFIDSSERKRLEEQFIQSQKMQAVGQLAGGIAHDFNNLLTAMIGFCDLLLQRYMPNDPSFTDVMQIKQNANRAANLVRQLLAFSRQQTLQPKVIHITDVLAELTSLLRRLIGAGIRFQLTHGKDIWPIKADISQLEQVIINLVVNARDAMKNDGNLTIQTDNYECLQQCQIGHDIMLPGQYSLIKVIDTGHGIAPENLQHIFEPFFSTKEVGKGTGLGLSTVYGIIKQTGGYIDVESTLGVGTTFKLYFPRYLGTNKVHSSHYESSYVGDLTGKETILLVEDEDAVRQFSARALRDKGYSVLEADCGESALHLVKKGKKHFDILITDVVMPVMDGPTLAQKIHDIMPHCEIIFISGYTEDSFRQSLKLNTYMHFLPKPFTLQDLVSKVKEVVKKKTNSPS